MGRKLVLVTSLSLVFMSMLSLAFEFQEVEASGTIYIRADGSIEDTTHISTVDNVPSTITDSINDSRSLVKKYFPVYNFSAGERWYPCSFYFDKDTDLYNKNSYDSYTPFPPPYYAYVHIAENTTHKTIQYWLYSVWNHHEVWPDHDSEWDSTIFVILEKTNGTHVPVEVYYFFHQAKEHRSWNDWPQKENTTHPVVYVANGSHGAYSSPEEMISNPKNFYVSDTWQPGGPILREEDFNWYLVGDSADHEHDPSEEYCNMTVEWIEGEPQWEFEENHWWPREFPQYPLVPMDPPWHRLDWMKGEITLPTISILSPENKTYSVKDISLTFTVSESTSWIGYSRDGQANITITGNTTLPVLSDGSHHVVVYANDTFGNMGASSTIYFTVDNAPPNITDVSQTPLKDNVQPNQVVKVAANVTDLTSGVKSVKLAYFINDSTIGLEFLMTFNSTTGLYVTSFGIPGQQANTLVRYAIRAYDNAGNHRVEDNDGQYYVYTVIPEFPSFLVLPLFMTATLLAVIVYRRRHF